MGMSRSLLDLLDASAGVNREDDADEAEAKLGPDAELASRPPASSSPPPSSTSEPSP
jgi:hypothetical protein